MPFTFQNLFIDQINEVYSAEQQIAEVMLGVIACTSSFELRELLNNYYLEVKDHVHKLENCFKELEIVPDGRKCRPIEGIVEETEVVIHRGGNSAIKDAAIIAVIQRFIHFKIAVYGAARTFARHLNYKAMDPLQRALNDEGEKNKAISRLAEGGMFTNGINEEAVRETVLT